MKIFDKSELKLLWPFYVDQFLMVLHLIIPFMIIYFSSIGLSALQIGILISVWSLASLIFEIPTGAISDIYGRKFSVILSSFLQGVLLITVFFFKSYSSLIILVILIGISQTLATGSGEAWVVDLLKAKKMQKFTHSYFSKSLSIANLGIVLSGLLGVIVVSKLGLGFIWIFSGISFFLSGFFLIFAEEIYESKKVRLKRTLKEMYYQTKNSFHYGYKHNVLFFLLIISFIFVLSQSLDSFISWTPLLKEFNFPDYAFGYLWSAMGALGIFAPLLSKKLLRGRKVKNFLALVCLLMVIYSFLILLSDNIYAVIILLFFSMFLWDLKSPVSKTYFHRFIPSKFRATMGSINSAILSLGNIIGLPIAGFLIEKIGSRYTIFISGLLMIPAMILYLKIKEDKK